MYSLLTVNGSGEVYYTRGFETLEACEIARSVALWGATPDEIRQAQRQQKEAIEEWERKNPGKTHPRYQGQMSPCYRQQDGEWIDYDPFGNMVLKNRFSIKTAKCIIEPGHDAAARASAEEGEVA